MASFTHQVAPVGSTGNNTHAGLFVGDDWEEMALLFKVEAIGATPTVTFKFQGSVDDNSITDGNAAWFDVVYVTDSTDTSSATTRVVTTVGSSIEWLSRSTDRHFRRVRLVTSANTNVTYSATATVTNNITT